VKEQNFRHFVEQDVGGRTVQGRSTYLRVLDARGCVVPGDDGGLGRLPRERDEVLGLGDVDGLLVQPGGEADDDAHPVAQRHRVHRRLHRRERVPVRAPASRHTQHPPLQLRHGMETEEGRRRRWRDSSSSRSLGEAVLVGVTVSLVSRWRVDLCVGLA
jgi:hypothetical protein